jgi:hypothetical protein
LSRNRVEQSLFAFNQLIIIVMITGFSSAHVMVMVESFPTQFITGNTYPGSVGVGRLSVNTAVLLDVREAIVHQTTLASVVSW